MHKVSLLRGEGVGAGRMVMSTLEVLGILFFFYNELFRAILELSSPVYVCVDLIHKNTCTQPVKSVCVLLKAR